uniref:Uncharacterized protein n=1 Tax=Equus asinus TaxID=9793 RepID=A0A9L0IW23_EQUAS
MAASVALNRGAAAAAALVGPAVALGGGPGLLWRLLQGAHAHAAHLLRPGLAVRMNFPYFYVVASVMLNVRLQTASCPVFGARDRSLPAPAVPVAPLRPL